MQGKLSVKIALISNKVNMGQNYIQSSLFWPRTRAKWPSGDATKKFKPSIKKKLQYFIKKCFVLTSWSLQRNRCMFQVT